MDLAGGYLASGGGFGAHEGSHSILESRRAGGGAGTWNTSNTNWDTGVVWTNGNSANFAGTAGTVTVSTVSASAVTFNTSAYTLASGTLALTTTAPTITVASGVDTISSLITDTSGVLITKAGAGTLVIGNTGGNSDGGYSLTAGVLGISQGSEIGSVPASPTVTIDFGANSTLQFETNVGTALSVNRTFQVNTGVTGFVDTKGFTVQTMNAWTSQTTGVYNLDDSVGTGTLVLNGSNDNTNSNWIVTAGTLDLTTASSSSVHAVDQSLAINGGAVVLGGTGGDQINNIASVAFTAGTLDLGGTSETINGLSGSVGVITNNGSANSTLTVGGNNGSGAFSGALQNGSTKTLALVQSGSGTLTLSGTNTYSGGTTVSAGTLVLGANTTTSGSPVTIANGPIGTEIFTISAGGTVDDNGSAITIANSVSTGNVTFGSTGSGNLTFDGTGLGTAASFAVVGASTTLTITNTTTIKDAQRTAATSSPRPAPAN